MLSLYYPKKNARLLFTLQYCDQNFWLHTHSIDFPIFSAVLVYFKVITARE